ncbi:zinc-dependent alcohol dehydrogenase [Microbacterium saperdae]|uniref:Threonine dehydrogenase-like Zn-dependent dehydrogenase n=1 Tax=Microbacterium saperdae TaxID=69368 RepID=A0A543BLA4_9MICO|nr:alcohol dehydrogenase catalytic domain-containing protein [Microbacterium saperdae]TQL85617.1 threonine dehydrogenase-like Zn-dependent dehydrogenase [Microbacterium saperdae]GGM62196.1 oxidoreductase [Microbacterium saperdae]
MLTEPAIRWVGPRRVVADDPAADRGVTLAPGRVRIEVTSAGLCGTDLSVWNGTNERAEPGTVLGHEFGGRIIAFGDGVDSMQIGDLVAVDPNLSCGRCQRCLDGRRALCIQRRLLGVDVDGGLQQTIDVDAAQLIPVPGADPRALGLVEPLAVGIHAVDRAGIAEGARVGVIGGGPIGMAAAVEAHLRGAVCSVLEADPARRRAIVDVGIADSVENPWENRSLDVVIDSVAREATVRIALDAVRDGGSVCLVGLSHDAHLPGPESLVRREITLTGSFCYRTADLRRAAEIVADRGVGVIPVELVDGLDAVPQLLESLAAGRIGRGKSIVIPRITADIP